MNDLGEIALIRVYKPDGSVTVFEGSHEFGLITAAGPMGQSLLGFRIVNQDKSCMEFFNASIEITRKAPSAIALPVAPKTTIQLR